ncbi:MAG: hypothetical protein LQ346_008050 [Caloplaca aetnensis]|nr:MAG: hypothetical protein LQ346_008050 [Caloplaca aetnensis]
MAVLMLESSLTQMAKYTAQSFAISLQRAPGVARSMWPAGDDLSRTIQIGHLQTEVNNITVELSNTLSRGLSLLMTDVPTFVAFADNGRYSNNNPPIDLNEVKNDLAITLQTFLVSESLKQNRWYATPLGISTKEQYENLRDPPPMCTVHGCSTPSVTGDQVYWSAASGRQYRFIQEGGGPQGPGRILATIRSSNWANLPLLFGGAYNCTFFGQVDNPQLIHVNFDSTLDIGCISKLPMKFPCNSKCLQLAADGSCPFPFNADCSYKNNGADSVHGGWGNR